MIDPDVIRTRSLLIWSQTRYRCATESVTGIGQLFGKATTLEWVLFIESRTVIHDMSPRLKKDPKGQQYLVPPTYKGIFTKIKSNDNIFCQA